MLNRLRWYHRLDKPAWTPPDLAVVAVWTGLYGLIALSGVLAARGAEDAKGRARLAGIYGFNTGLSGLWAVLFFGFRRPDWALVEVAPLWLSIPAMMGEAGRRRRTPALLLAPYLLWVTLAAGLNADLVRRNRPFG